MALRAYQGDEKYTYGTGQPTLRIGAIFWGVILTFGGIGAVLAFFQVAGFN